MHVESTFLQVSRITYFLYIKYKNENIELFSPPFKGGGSNISLFSKEEKIKKRACLESSLSFFLRKTLIWRYHLRLESLLYL